MRAFITGSAGSVGIALQARLKPANACCGYDIAAHPAANILDVDELRRRIVTFDPTVIFHLAGAKHAGSGERTPTATTEVNVLGTANVIRMAECPVVVASTCKAADPETAYGASKLIAERIALNAGHSVARFYNVRESAGNVFETWAALDGALPVTDCWRYFITMSQAVDLLLAVASSEPGRYTVNPGPSRHMTEIAAEAYPGRAMVRIPARRGDRLREPRVAACETLEGAGDGLERVRGPHDSDRAPAADAGLRRSGDRTGDRSLRAA